MVHSDAAKKNKTRFPTLPGSRRSAQESYLISYDRLILFSRHWNKKVNYLKQIFSESQKK